MAISLSVDIREVDYHEEQGTETLTVIASVTTSGETYNTTGTASGYMALDIEGSVTDYENDQFTCSFGKNQTTQIYSQTFTVNRGPTATASVKVTLNTGVSAGTISKTITKTLMSSGNNIEIVGLSTSNNYMDQTYTVKLAYPVAAATADVYVQSFGTLPAGGRTIATGTTATEIPWTPTTAQFASYCTDSQSAVCTVRADFKTSGGVKISSFDATFRLVVPESVRPSVSSVSVVDASGDYEDYGVITSDSVLTVTANASSQYGATIRKAQAKLGTDTYGVTVEMTKSGSSWVCTIDDIPTAVSDPDLTVTVWDTRGRTAKWTDGMSTGESANLFFNVSLTSAVRYANGAEDPNADSVRVSTYYTSTSPGGGARSATLKTSYRRVGASSWTTYSTLNVAGGSEKYQSITISGLSASYSWDVQLTLSAGGDTTTWTTTVSTGRPIMDFAVGGKAISMWGVAGSDQSGLYVGRKLRADSDLHISNRVIREFREGGETTQKSFLETDENTGRAVVCDHIGIRAGMWIQGMVPELDMPGFEGEDVENALVRFTSYNMMRVNEDGGLELNWTDGGLSGTAWKQLWTGTWSSGGTTTYIYDLPRYHCLLFVLGGSLAGQRVPVWRQTTSGSIFAGMGAMIQGGTTGHILVGYANVTSSYRLNVTTSYPVTDFTITSGTTHTRTGFNVTEIWGVI